MEDLRGDAAVRIMLGWRGKARVARGGAASGPQCAGEHQPVGVMSGIGCCRVHQERMA